MEGKLAGDMEPLDPNKTILVVKHQGREVGRIPATAKNAETYLTELRRLYKEITIGYERDETGGLLALLHKGR